MRLPIDGAPTVLHLLEQSCDGMDGAAPKYCKRFRAPNVIDDG